METVTLMGAEKVETASFRMAEAATDMMRAAGTIEEAMRAHARALEDHQQFFREALAIVPSAVGRQVEHPDLTSSGCGGCAKVARHPGEGYQCARHPEVVLLAQAVELIRQSMMGNHREPRPRPCWCCGVPVMDPGVHAPGCEAFGFVDRYDKAKR